MEILNQEQSTCADKFHTVKTFISHSFPKLQRVTTDIGRRYQTSEGKSYPSVTTVTGFLSAERIQEWRNSVGHEVANKITARASKRGTAIHSLCEDYLLGKHPEPTMFDSDMFNSLKPHLDLIDNIHCLETQMYSDHLQVAGTVDCIAEYNGKLCVIDFKTSSKPKQRDWIHGYFMQKAAYAVMFEEHTGIPITRLLTMMAVDDHPVILFYEKRDDWIGGFKELRERFRKAKGQ